MNLSILFFGSTSDSLLVLNKLHEHGWNIAAVITQPPRPIGRKQILTPTPTELWAKEKNITVVSFPNAHQSFLYENEDAVINTLETFKADVLISASYGQKIPSKTITDARFGGINIHPSLLPRWRGADPIPWEILSGDHQTGATMVTLTESMDEGKIIVQKKIPLLPGDTHIQLREKLFTLGADLLVENLPKYIDGTIKGEFQDAKKATTARRLKRDDGFIPWNIVQNAIHGTELPSSEFPKFLQQFFNPENTGSFLIVRAINGLSPWPGVWTTIDGKRVKILSGHSEYHDEKNILCIDLIQEEGKTPQQWNESLALRFGML